MATAMLTDRGLRRKMGTDEPRSRGAKRKSTTSRARQEQNNNVKRQRINSTLDPKTDMLGIYQPWVIQTYGDLAKTKTITIKKYARILRTLRGEEVVSADNSKFRFWVKAKGFHVGRPPSYDAKPADAIVGRYSVCDSDTGIPSLGEKLTGSAKDPPLYVPNAPFKNSNGEPVYRKVAVVENFFDIIYNVHVELEGRPGKHAGQKRTYRTITETYAFLPREAVTRFLLGCTECQRRPRSPSPAVAALPPSLPTPSPSPTLPLPPAAAPRALTDLGPAAPPPSLPAAQPPLVIHVHHTSTLNLSQSAPDISQSHTKIDGPLRTSTPTPAPSAEPKRSSNPLDVCNLTSRNSPPPPPPPQSPTTPTPAKICTPPKKRHLNHLSDASRAANERDRAPAPKLWSPVEGIGQDQSHVRTPFPEGEIDYSLPITTTYLKYMRSLGCTDDDALKFEKTAETLKSSTLWSVYSMLKSTLRTFVDISVYRKLIAYIKRQNEGYMAKKSKVLTMDHVIMFLSKAPDDLFLFMKVVLIFALHGACRGDELRMLQVDNIEDNGSVLVVTLHDTKTKKKRVFTILSDVRGVNGIALYRTYLSLRPKSISHRRFFVCYRKGKCTVQPVGINTFYSIPRKIGEYLKFPNASSYTGHCFRRTSATLLAESGADIQMLKRHGGWRSSTVAEGYVEESIENKINTTRRIFNGQHNVSKQPSSIGTSCVSSTVASSERASTFLSVSDFQSMASSSGTTFNNLHNCTFVININKCNDNE